MNAVNPAAEAATPKSCPSCGARYAADALFCSLDGAPLTTSPGAMAAAAATDPYVGKEILGHIEIRQLVGLGAMGRVYRAFQRGIDRDVAVKILHRELSANQMLVSRFHREAKVASRLQHPNVVHCILTGQLPDGSLYIVMEYLDGLSLQSALGAAGGAMPLPRALHVALQLCDAAGEAHVQGVVHRDLKPENVMLVRRADDPDYVKVLDFGIARLNWGEQSMATAAGLIFGTARYISPEGAQGEKVTPQGDVYSIATMIYQMLAGRTPFDGEQAVALLVQQIHDVPMPLRDVPRASYVPEAIADVVMENLAKKPEERAENARTLGRALLDAAVTSGLSAQDILARPSMTGPGRAPHSSVVQMPSMQRTSKMQLEPDVAARIAAKTSYEPPVEPPPVSRPYPRTEIPEPALVKPGAATTKWIPPEEFAPRLVAPTAVPAPEPSRPSIPGIDSTMDDSQLSTTPPVPSASSPLMTPAPASSPLLGRGETAPPLSRSAPPSSSPGVPVDTTIAGDEATGRHHVGRRGGAAVVIVACFLVGMVGMAGVAYKTGLIGRRAPAVAAAAPVAAALPVAVQMPTPAPTASAAPPLSAQDDPGSSIPPLSSTHPASALVGLRVAVDVSSARPGVGQPVDLIGRVGGPTRPKVDSPSFLISGPGIAPGTHLEASGSAPGTYGATFTFLQTGRFEVTFVARADGSPVRSARVVTVGATNAPPPLPGPSQPRPALPPPSTTDGTRWL